MGFEGLTKQSCRTWIGNQQMGQHRLPIQMRVRFSRAVSGFLLRHRFRGRERLLRLAARWLMPRPAGPTIVPVFGDLLMWVDPASGGVDRSLYYFGTYEAGTLHIMARCLRPGDTFLDIGANIGLMTLAASRAVGGTGQVHTFEPLPESRTILERNLVLNHTQSVVVHAAALGSRAQRSTLYAFESTDRGMATLIPPATALSSVDVEVLPLDEIIQAQRLMDVRMVKIDVEGWELEVLKGATKLLAQENPPILCIEYCAIRPGHRGTILDLTRWLTRINSYRLYRLEFGKNHVGLLKLVGSEQELPHHDNLFCVTDRQRTTLQASLFAASGNPGFVAN